MKSKPFNLYLRKEELSAFVNFLPIFSLASDQEQRNRAIKLLGYTSKTRFFVESHYHSHLRDSYYFLLFLVMTHDEGNQEEIQRLINRMRFISKEVEVNVKGYFGFKEDEDSLSIGELEEMWNLTSSKK